MFIYTSFWASALVLLQLVSSASSFTTTSTRRAPSKQTSKVQPFYTRSMAGGLILAADGGTTTDDTAAVPIEDPHAELMYALGVNLARQLGDVRPLVENGEELAQVAKGLLDTVVGRLDDNGQREILSRRAAELDKVIAARASVLRQKLEMAGREMLQNMAETDGAASLDNGVVLHVLEHGPEGEGRGVRPTGSSVVLIHYHGTLPDGSIFDSTMGGEPAKFPLAQVIPGWRDGVLNMRVGETAMLGIPPEQAYGEHGTPDGRIPGGATLFFKIQLVDVLSAGIVD